MLLIALPPRSYSCSTHNSGQTDGWARPFLNARLNVPRPFQSLSALPSHLVNSRIINPHIIILASSSSHHTIHQYDVCQYDVCRFFELSDRRRWGTLTG